MQRELAGCNDTGYRIQDTGDKNLSYSDFIEGQQDVVCCGRCWSSPDCPPKCKDAEGNPLPSECCQAGAGGGGLATPAWAGEISAGCTKCTGPSRSKCRKDCFDYCNKKCDTDKRNCIKNVCTSYKNDEETYGICAVQCAAWTTAFCNLPCPLGCMFECAKLPCP